MSKESKNADFSYEIDESSNQHIIDERGNTYLMLAKYRWFNKGDFKLGIRTFYSTADGEKLGKGVSFLTDEGPHELTKSLLEDGYGHAQEIAQTLKESRPEIIGAIMDELLNMTKEEKDACKNAYVNCGDFIDDDNLYNPEDILEDGIA